MFYRAPRSIRRSSTLEVVLPCPTPLRTDPGPRRSPNLGFPPASALLALALLPSLACFRGGHDRRDPAATVVQPELTRLVPNRGFPGTEVVLEGRHLAHPLQVSYQGRPLAAEQIEVLGDAQIRVRLPDDAQGEAILSVTNAAGTSGKYFFVKPGIREVLQQPFVPVHAVQHDLRMLDFPDYRRTGQDGRLQLPIAPVLEPRHGARPEVGQGCILNFRLPAPFQEVLPASVQALLKAQGIESHRVDILCVSQPLGPDAGAQVFHPHAWIEARGGVAGPHPKGFRMGVALREQAPGIHFEGQAPDAFLELATEAPFPDELVLAGLPAQTSTAFWSVTRLGAQAAVTLHLLLEERHQQALAAIAGHADRFPDLLRHLATAPELKDTAVFQAFQALFRPRLAGSGRVLAHPDPGLCAIRANGTGLAATRAVTVGGQPVTTFQALSDGLLQLTIPRTWAGGALVVTTDLGASDPVALPPIK